LLKSKHAYRQEGNVLFRVKGHQAYGQLSNQVAEKLQSERKIAQINKETPQDFVL